jgi:hypothetical protein
VNLVFVGTKKHKSLELIGVEAKFIENGIEPLKNSLYLKL